jgi:hypothetical protein
LEGGLPQLSMGSKDGLDLKGERETERKEKKR